MGSAEPDYRRVELLWDFMARFQLAVPPPDKFDDAVTGVLRFRLPRKQGRSS